MNKGSPDCDPVDASTPERLLKSRGNVRSSHLPLLKVNEEENLAQVAEVHKKGMNSVSPEACILPYTEW